MRLGGGGSGSDATASRATDPDVLLSQSNGSAPLPHEKDSRTMRPGSSSGGGGSPARIPKDSGSVVAPSTTLAIPNTQSGTNLTNLQDAAIETEQVQQPQDPDGSAEGSQIDRIDQQNLILTNPDNAIEEEHHQPQDPDGSAEGGQIDRIDQQNLIVIEKDIITFVTQNLWDDVEKHLVKIIDIPEALHVHPVLFLHIRRSKLLYLLDMKRYDDAISYFASDIKGPFDEVKNLGQEKLTFASVRYLTAQINFCSLCVTTKERVDHPHGDPAKIHHVICDYFRVNIPSKIRYEEPPTNHKMWRFGIRDVTPAGNKKASFRCMVCQRVFHKESVGILENHLRKCFMMNTKYLKQLFEAFRSLSDEVETGARGPPKGRSRPLGQQQSAQSQMPTSEVLPQSQNLSLSTTECIRLYRDNLGAARLVKDKMAEGPHDACWITLLGVALDNVETYGNLVISRLGPEPGFQTAASTPPVNSGTQLVMPRSVQAGPSAASAPPAPPVNSGTQLVMPRSGQTTSVPLTLQVNDGASVPSSAPIVSATTNRGHPLQTRANNVDGSAGTELQLIEVVVQSEKTTQHGGATSSSISDT